MTCISFLLASCSLPGDAAPVVKIGLIAPFEGVGRPFGYGILPAVKAAIAEANASGQLGRYRVALVALNDDLDPRAAAGQAKALAQDPELLVALGPWSEETAAAAAPILSQAGIPALVAVPLDAPPAGVFSLCPPSSEQETRFLAENGFLASPAAEGTKALACGLAEEPPAGFVATYQARTGAAPGPDALLAYAGARVILQALARDVAAHGRPARAGVMAALGAHPVESRLVWYRVENGRWVK